MTPNAERAGDDESVAVGSILPSATPAMLEAEIAYLTKLLSYVSAVQAWAMRDYRRKVQFGAFGEEEWTATVDRQVEVRGFVTTEQDVIARGDTIEDLGRALLEIEVPHE